VIRLANARELTVMWPLIKAEFPVIYGGGDPHQFAHDSADGNDPIEAYYGLRVFYETNPI
jgi:hypothetical protein